MDRLCNSSRGLVHLLARAFQVSTLLHFLNLQLTDVAQYPMTPAKTPIQKASRTEPALRKKAAFSELRNRGSVDLSTEGRGAKFGRPADLQFSQDTLPSPPNTSPMGVTTRFDMAPMPSPGLLNMNSLNTLLTGDCGDDSSYYSPMSTALSPNLSSFQSSPEISQLPLGNYENPWGNVPDLKATYDTSNYAALTGHDLSKKSTNAIKIEKGSPEKPSQFDLDLEAALRDTGITMDDIAGFISGPDPGDGKWLCLFPECKKKFGRKENIKSHVQTHLGDRQYRCPHCKKCFVRQHDLKRHAKIHSGVKPYPCLCGNSFARHDALTRHRQRGMCIGAFEGVVRKVVKRGRPRKVKAEGEEETRGQRVRRKANSMSSGSSSSGQSDSSRYQSPILEDGQSFEYDDTRAIDAISQVFDNNSTGMSPKDMGMSPEEVASLFDYTPPTSPSHEMTGCVSPQHTQHSHTPQARGFSPTISAKRHSIISIADGNDDALYLPSHPQSPTKDSQSQYNTPPELSLSSSSPAPSVGARWDMETQENINQSYNHSQQSHSEDHNSPSFGLTDITEDAEEMFNDCFGLVNGLSTLEKDPSLLMTEKIDSCFNEDVLFQDNSVGDDVFSPTPC
jgi:regulatory protein SWI5